MTCTENLDALATVSGTISYPIMFDCKSMNFHCDANEVLFFPPSDRALKFGRYIRQSQYFLVIFKT